MDSVKTLTLEVGKFWYADTEYGPPLPHSLWLWELWGCYEHYDCVPTLDLFTPKGERDRIIHHTLDSIKLEAYSHTDTCDCWRHWLLGDRSDKDYPQLYEPIIRQDKKGRKNGQSRND